MRLFVAALLVGLAACSSRTMVPAPVAPAALPPATTARAAEIVVSSAPTGRTVSADAFGANVGTWYDFTLPFVTPAMQGAGFGLVRFPGGSQSDFYHWERGGYVCGKNLGYVAPQDSFDNFVSTVVKPLHADVAITLDYGSNPACDGGGDPNEAIGWMRRARQLGAPVKYWTLGNEVYGSYEYDLHPHPHSAAEYAAAFHGQFWPAIKKAFPSARLGIVVGDYWWSWTTRVLHLAKPFDFVEFHYYPEGEFTDDARLLSTGIDYFAGELAGLRTAMRRAGVPDGVPIYVGEYNSSYSNLQGKQSVSIVNGLYYGQMLGTLIDAGVPASSWWLAFGGTNCSGHGDFGKGVYGFQHFGTFTLFSDGLKRDDPACPGTPALSGGVPFPTARVVTLYRRSVPAGSAVLAVREPRHLAPSVRAYAYGVASGGYVLVLFNNTLSQAAVDVRIEGAARKSYEATMWTYGTPQYDRSRFGHWVGPDSRRLGSVSPSHLPIALVPYGMTVVRLR